MGYSPIRVNYQYFHGTKRNIPEKVNKWLAENPTYRAMGMREFGMFGAVVSYTEIKTKTENK